MEYQRTPRVDDTKPVKHLVSLTKDVGSKYKKHRSSADNCSTVFPMMKDIYDRKFNELDFSQNLAIRPKLEIQWYHYHLSDDTKNDGVFVDPVLRDLIINYNISNENLWVQSDNASSQYKNKHSFGRLQSLADEFNLRIIRNYGVAGHGREAIDDTIEILE